MNDRPRRLADHILAVQGQLGIVAEVTLGELAIDVAPAQLPVLLAFLRDDPACEFRMLIDLCGVDYPERPDRFLVAYNLLSLTQNARCRVRTRIDEAGEVPSIADLYPAAAWFEREAYDLYGIFFAGNADLRRLLTDYGFEGHPFRKDFPLTGHVEMRYDEREKRVVYEPVKLTQDFRAFDFVSPWEGMLTPRRLPGDEKANS